MRAAVDSNKRSQALIGLKKRQRRPHEVHREQRGLALRHPAPHALSMTNEGARCVRPN